MQQAQQSATRRHDLCTAIAATFAIGHYMHTDHAESGRVKHDGNRQFAKRQLHTTTGHCDGKQAKIDGTGTGQRGDSASDSPIAIRVKGGSAVYGEKQHHDAGKQALPAGSGSGFIGRAKDVAGKQRQQQVLLQ